MLAIAIGLVLAILALRQYHVQSTIAASNETAQAVTTLDAIANRLYADSLGYTQTLVTPTSTQPFYHNGSGTTQPVDMLALYNAGGAWPGAVRITIPTSGPLTDADFTDAWGGAFTVGPASSDGTTQDLLQVSLTAIPNSVCIQLLALLAPSQYSTTVNGSLVGLTPPPTVNAPGRDNVNYAQAGPLCTGASNTLVFTQLKPMDFMTLRDNVITPTISPAESARLDPEYARIQNALAARETAQNGLP